MPMRIEVWNKGARVAESLSGYVALRLVSVVDQLARGIRSVTVDVGGPTDDGRPARCRMVAQLEPAGAVGVEELGPDLYLVVDRAADRLARGVAVESGLRAAALAGAPPSPGERARGAYREAARRRSA